MDGSKKEFPIYSLSLSENATTQRLGFSSQTLDRLISGAKKISLSPTIIVEEKLEASIQPLEKSMRFDHFLSTPQVVTEEIAIDNGSISKKILFTRIKAFGTSDPFFV
ncbi:hypothetical protein HAX54_038874 [Datura stramonium]|uniref:Uncharacterized protein n=1 Tax=Datura stramonium TaxID=4076 RepID=A0ABS8SII6_DATST|nr:hypothetical protein [Datura stramonium]